LRHAFARVKPVSQVAKGTTRPARAAGSTSRAHLTGNTNNKIIGG
jgi:hypothetical protein